MTEWPSEAPRRWTPWRIAGAVLLGFVLLFLFAFAAGFLAAHLDAGTGERVWRERIKAIVLLVLLAIPVVAGLVAWRRSRAAEAKAPAGEARAIRRSRSYWTVLGIQSLLGMVVGYLSARWMLHGNDGVHELPAWPALAMAVAYVVGTVWGSVALYPKMDELDREDSLWGGAAAASVVLIVYPAWLFLWLGGWTGEPNHYVLMALLFVTMMGTYFYRKSRH